MSIDRVPNFTPQETDFFHVDRIVRKMATNIGLATMGLYTILKSYMDYKTRECHPTHDTLSKVCGCDIKTIRKLVKILELHGMIKVQRRYKQANVYYLVRKNWWGVDIECLPPNVTMRCPEHNLGVVMVNKKFLCPKCLMDVGKYCEEIFEHHFPEITKRDIYGSNKSGKEHSFHDNIPDSYYEKVFAEGEKYQDNPYPLYDCYVDFENLDAKPALTLRSKE